MSVLNRHCMRLRSAAMAGMLFAAHVSVSGQALSPQQRLEQLAVSTSLDRSEINPWHLITAFDLSDIDGHPQDSGILEAWWTGKHMITLVSSKSVHGPLPSSDEAFADGTGRETYLFRTLLDQITHPVPQYHDFSGLDVSEQPRTVGKAKLVCVEVGRTKPGAAPGLSTGSFCEEANGPGPLRVHYDMGQFVAVLNRIGRFQNVNVALQQVITYSGVVAIKGDVQKLETVDVQSLPSEHGPEEEQHQAVPAVVFAGRKVNKFPPEYPFQAREQHLSGSVVLAATIDKTGHIRNLVPIASSARLFTDSAIKAVKQWTYEPFLRDGQPVEVDTTIAVNYNITQH